MSEVKIVAAQREQSKASKKATADRLRAKKRRTKTVSINVDGDDMELTFSALSAHELDTLQAKYPPTPDQRAKGMAFDPDKFNPALVAACLADPAMTLEEVKDMWDSPDWSLGELQFLLNTAQDLCTEGLNIPFFDNA